MVSKIYKRLLASKRFAQQLLTKEERVSDHHQPSSSHCTPYENVCLYSFQCRRAGHYRLREIFSSSSVTPIRTTTPTHPHRASLAYGGSFISTPAARRITNRRGKGQKITVLLLRCMCGRLWGVVNGYALRDRVLFYRARDGGVRSL